MTKNLTLKRHKKNPQDKELHKVIEKSSANKEEFEKLEKKAVKTESFDKKNN